MIWRRRRPRFRQGGLVLPHVIGERHRFLHAQLALLRVEPVIAGHPSAVGYGDLGGVPLQCAASNLFTTPLGIRSSGDNGIIETYSVTPYAEVPGTV